MRYRRLLLLLAIALLALCAGFALIHRTIHNYDDRIIADPARLDTNEWSRPRVAIVFGASVYSSGVLSATLEERVATAITLYRTGKIDRILVSGDNRHPSYNEPRAMQEYLISHAVAPRDVIVDYAGRSTYETCLRAHEIFGLNRAVLVTQRFHLPRALYIANELGLDASGVATDPDATRTLGYQSLRELAAEIKAYLNVRLVPPRTILGERLPIR